MEKPATIQEPWTNFPQLSYSFIQDHFVHNNLATLKVDFKGPKGGADIKQSIINS